MKFIISHEVLASCLQQTENYSGYENTEIKPAVITYGLKRTRNFNMHEENAKMMLYIKVQRRPEEMLAFTNDMLLMYVQQIKH